MRIGRRDQRLAVCYHEAGHAVIGLIMQLDVRGVTLSEVAPGHYHGVTEVRASELRGPSWRDRQILMLLAGHTAASQRQPGSIRRDRGAAGDWTWIRTYLGLNRIETAAWTPRERHLRERRILAPHRQRARALVRGHWAAIEAVALALALCEHLDRAALIDLVNRARPAEPITWNGVWYPPFTMEPAGEVLTVGQE
jgi:hypothetical protein